jgi:2-hydroxychromene-2-carboxylate isomerase
MKAMDYYMSPAAAQAGAAALEEIGARHGVARGDEEDNRAFTQEALERGVFGAPSYVYRDEIFWARTASNFWNAP